MVNHWGKVFSGVVLLVVVLLCSTVGHSAMAQAFWRVEETKTNVNTYYYYSLNPGSATVRVQMLGAVRLPGLYEIGEGTDLGQLIALSGGPPLGVQPKNTRIDVSLRVFRPSKTGPQVIFEDSFERTLANPESYPLLMDGDVVVMEVMQQQRFGWRDAASIVSTIAVLALASERLSRMVR